MRSRIGWRAGIGALVVFSAALALTFVGHDAAWAAKGGGGRPGGEAAGNNLSFPVIWSEGVAKVLRGVYDDETLNGGVWYAWTDDSGDPATCEADADNTDLCDDGVEGQADGKLPCEAEEDPPVPPVPDCRLVYPQQDSVNTWQAGSLSMKDESGNYTDVLNVDYIDWGDNLESVDWYTRSQVRTEVVLIQDVAGMDMLQYEMTHLYGLGMDELWGLNTTGLNHEAPSPVKLYDAPQATVYSHCARLTIQKLLVDRDDPELAYLTWMPTDGFWIGLPGYEHLINPPIFNKTVHEGGDGPGYYSAEINVKGKVIYGYTWNVRKLNDKIVNGGTADGDYRITFSFDQTCPTVDLNTFFDGSTVILEPAEEEEATEAEEPPGGGAVAVLDVDNNLTYMDVRILERSGGMKDK